MACGPARRGATWKFSKTSGWYVTVDKGKRRLFYLFPKPGSFLLKMTFNDKALELIRNSDLPATVKSRLNSARSPRLWSPVGGEAGPATPGGPTTRPLARVVEHSAGAAPRGGPSAGRRTVVME
ncbi:MAG: DUF3788 family protein [Flavobacteriales bacterium]|nr:DUF3788 family protein [Flavobacteriales bacterium]